MVANPYAVHLGNERAVEVIAATTGRLASLTAKLGKDGTEKAPAPGKWSAREILCHLADCEIVFAYRLRQALAEDNHVIQPFDQDRFAEHYAGYDAAGAMAVFTAVRQWNLKLIESLKAESLSRPLSHPERGAMTFQTVVETMAGHDLNHVKQMEAMTA